MVEAEAVEFGSLRSYVPRMEKRALLKLYHGF